MQRSRWTFYEVVKGQFFKSLYVWQVSALFFWVSLACLEVTRAVVIDSFPPPLGRGSFPSIRDIHYIIVALSVYALFSIPSALILFSVESVFSWRGKKTRASFLDFNSMDLYLLFAWGLLFFKWISNLMPYLIEGEHLPYTPYLLGIPLLGLYGWLSSLFKEGVWYYRIQWIVVVAGVIFLSKTTYDIFFKMSFSLQVQVGIVVFFAVGSLFTALVFYSLLNRILLRSFTFSIGSAFLYTIVLSGGLLFSLNAFHTRNDRAFTLHHSPTHQKGEGGIAKNVVIILVDCLRADHLECYGYKKRTSPFLNDIARLGVMFENGIAPSSWTIPSVVSLFTGVYPQQHGVNECGTVIPEKLTSLQEIMKGQGMCTAAFITNDFLRPRWGYANGFCYYFDHYLEQSFEEYVTSRLFFLNALLHFKNELLCPYSVDPGGTRWWSIGFPPFNHERISAERVTGEVVKWIDLHREQPFYIYVHYMDVHCPYDSIWYPLFDREAYASQSLKEKLINVYDGRIAYIDKQIHRIWQYLKQRNLADNTLFIITSDHGEELYDHEGTGHCTTLYEELIRVPLIVVNPSLSGLRQRVEEQIQLVDVPPTVLDFLALPIPETVEGRSLLPLLKNHAYRSEHSYAISYSTRGRKGLTTEEGRALWEKKIWDQGITLTSLRVGNEWKIIEGGDGSTELYNLKEDKEEQHNLSIIEQPILEDLKKKLREESSRLKSFITTREKLELSPDTSNKLRALGYL